MSFQINTLVMAGGQGTRFWPESIKSKPKQYLSLVTEKSLIEETLFRLGDLVHNENRYVITTEDQVPLVKQQCGSLMSDGNIIVEPYGRNTSPCIQLALASLLSKGSHLEDVVAIVPADHVILNHEGFRSTISKAAMIAHSKSEIVTIGIPPTFPQTGFGYIQLGDERSSDKGFDVVQFKEKPSLEVAKEYVASGKYMWNAGMFVTRIDTLLSEFFNLTSLSEETFESLKNAIGDSKKISELYESLEATSIDYSIMEKSKKVSLIKANFDWNDLGSWDALSEVIEQTDDNTIVNSKGHKFVDSKDNIVFAPGKFVGLINVNDLIVVSNDKTVLVAHKDNSQDVKKIVEFLKSNDEYKNLL